MSRLSKLKEVERLIGQAQERVTFEFLAKDELHAKVIARAEKNHSGFGSIVFVLAPFMTRKVQRAIEAKKVIMQKIEEHV